MVHLFADFDDFDVEDDALNALKHDITCEHYILFVSGVKEGVPWPPHEGATGLIYIYLFLSLGIFLEAKKKGIF